MDFQRGPRHGRRHELARTLALRDVNFSQLNNNPVVAVAISLPRKGHRCKQRAGIFIRRCFISPTLAECIKRGSTVPCLPCVGISEVNLTAKVPTCWRTNSTRLWRAFKNRKSLLLFRSLSEFETLQRGLLVSAPDDNHPRSVVLRNVIASAIL